jgi:hypothetical protein
VVAFICDPISLIWENAAEFGGPKCFNILAFNYYNAAFFILSDLFLAISPVLVLKDMQMNRKRKGNASGLKISELRLTRYSPLEHHV